MTETSMVSPSEPTLADVISGISGTSKAPVNTWALTVAGLKHLPFEALVALELA